MLGKRKGFVSILLLYPLHREKFLPKASAPTCLRAALIVLSFGFSTLLCLAGFEPTLHYTYYSVRLRHGGFCGQFFPETVLYIV